MDVITLLMIMVVGVVTVVIIAIIIVSGIRNGALKREEKKLAHAERMRAIEMGHPLPDGEVARAKADAIRANAAGTIGTLVPVVALLAAAGTSLMVLRDSFVGQWHGMYPHTQLLMAIWIPAGIVSLTTVIGSLRSLRRPVPVSTDVAKIADSARAGESQLTGIKEKVTPI